VSYWSQLKGSQKTKIIQASPLKKPITTLGPSSKYSCNYFPIAQRRGALIPISLVLSVYQAIAGVQSGKTTNHSGKKAPAKIIPP